MLPIPPLQSSPDTFSAKARGLLHGLDCKQKGTAVLPRGLVGNMAARGLAANRVEDREARIAWVSDMWVSDMLLIQGLCNDSVRNR